MSAPDPSRNRAYAHFANERGTAGGDLCCGGRSSASTRRFWLNFGRWLRRGVAGEHGAAWLVVIVKSPLKHLEGPEASLSDYELGSNVGELDAPITPLDCWPRRGWARYTDRRLPCMWHLVPWKTQLLLIGGAFVGFAVAVQWLASLLHVEAPHIFQLVGILSIAVSIGVFGFVGLCWRPVWRFCPSIARRTFPDMTGIWEGNLESNVSEQKNETNSLRPVTMRIRQGLFETHIECLTQKSHSASVHSFLELARSRRVYMINYLYEFNPMGDAVLGKHEGFGRIVYQPDDDPNVIRGSYYTARHTGGSFSLTRTSSTVCRSTTKAAEPTVVG